MHFTRAFYKHILNQPIQYTDLESTDPDYYKSLTMMLSHHVDDLGLDLTFSVEGVSMVYGMLRIMYDASCIGIVLCMLYAMLFLYHMFFVSVGAIRTRLHP